MTLFYLLLICDDSSLKQVMSLLPELTKMIHFSISFFTTECGLVHSNRVIDGSVKTYESVILLYKGLSKLRNRHQDGDIVLPGDSPRLH